MAASNGSRATWNDQGYYFAENGEFVWRDMYTKIAAEAKKQGYIQVRPEHLDILLSTFEG